MTTIEDRLEHLEQQLRLSRRVGAALAAVVAITVCVAARQGEFPNLVCGSMAIKDNVGSTKTSLFSNGDVDIGGKLRIGGFDVLAESRKTGNELSTLATNVARIEKRLGEISNCVIREYQFSGSDILANGATRHLLPEKAAKLDEFPRPLKNAHVAISSVHTVNDFHGGAHPVAEYSFAGHAVIDPANRRKVSLFICHHMTDYSQGSMNNGFIKVLIVGEYE